MTSMYLEHADSLTSSDVLTITNGLQVAAEQFDGNVKEFENLARHLREGGEFPMFAPGAGGARAAERLAEQFTQQAVDSRRLAELIQDADRVIVVPDDRVYD